MRGERPCPREAGYALISTLWLVAGVTLVATTVSVLAMDGVTLSNNRIALRQATWAAEACTARALALIERAALDAAWEATTAEASSWHALDVLLRTSVRTHDHDCMVMAVPTGSRVDVNAVDSMLLAELLRVVGYAPPKADTVAHRILAQRRESGSIRAMDQLRHLDPEFLSRAERVLDVDPAVVSFYHATPEVIGAVVGVGNELRDWIVEHRMADGRPLTLDQLTLSVPAPLRREWDAAASSVLGALSLSPGAWMVEAEGYAGSPRVTVGQSVRVRRESAGVDVSHFRRWMR